jgi:AraC-like DNA-binding protein
MPARETQSRIEYLRPPALPGVDLVRMEYTTVCKRPSMVPELMLALVDEGAGEVQCERHVAQLSPGKLLVRAPGRVGEIRRLQTPAARVRMALIDPRLLREHPRDQPFDDKLLSRFSQVVTTAPVVVEPYIALWRAVDQQASPADQQDRLGRLLDVLTLALLPLSPGATRPPAPAIRRIRDALQERFAEELSLVELARIAGMSKCHLVHMFHREVGLPPHAFQIQVRVARARSLIAAGVPLAEVATMTGFADQSHLTRLFKRTVGVPPGKYAGRTARIEPASPPEYHAATTT